MHFPAAFVLYSEHLSRRHREEGWEEERRHPNAQPLASRRNETMKMHSLQGYDEDPRRQLGATVLFFFFFFFFGSLEPDVLHVFYIFVHFNQKVFAFLKATRGFIVSVIIGPVTVLGRREGDRQRETEEEILGCK